MGESRSTGLRKMPPWMIPAIVYVVAMGCLGITSKIAVQRVGWQEQVLWMAVIYLVVASALVVTGHVRNVHFDFGGVMAISTGALAAGSAVLFFLVVRDAEVSRAVPFMASYPVVTIVLAFAVFSERLTIVQAVGVAFVLGGLVMVTAQSR